jgi:hypothetical protein
VKGKGVGRNEYDQIIKQLKLKKKGVEEGKIKY